MWDIKQRRGWWLHIQPYVDKKLRKDPAWLAQKKAKEKRNIHIPFAQTIPCEEENALLALIKAQPPVWKVLDGAMQVLDADPHYRLEAHLTSTGTQITAVEKYPGAAAAKPIHIKFMTAIPTDNEKGRDLAEKVKQFIDSGVPVKIPLPYIKDLEFPDFIKQALPEFTQDGYFLLGRAQNPTPLLLRCELTAEDGQGATLEYVHLKVVQAGQEEVTLTNEEQPLPIKVKLIMRSNGTITTHFSTLSTPHVHLLLKQLQLQHCLSRPSTVRLISVETGIPIATVQQVAGSCDAPSPWFLQVIKTLHAFQSKTRKPITFPDRELTEEEWQLIDQLQRIFQEGKIKGTWNSLRATLSVLPENVAEMGQFVKAYEEGKIHELTFFLEETATLFGVDLPLGKTKTTYVQARLVNVQEVLERLAKQKAGTLSLHLQFVAGDDCAVVKEYLDWSKP